MSTVFPFRVDWFNPFIERRSYATDVLLNQNGKEQRRQLRGRAVREWDFTVTPIGEEESWLFERVAQNIHGQEVMLPFWPHHTLLNVAVSPGANTFVVDTTNRDFIVGGWLMLWTSVAAYEVLQISAVSATTLTTSTTCTGTYGAGASVVPAWNGWLNEMRDIDRATTIGQRVEMSFRLTQSAIPATTATAGATATLFTIGTVPDRIGRTDTILRDRDRFDSPTYGFRDTYHTDRNLYQFRHDCILDGWSETAGFWQWYDGVIGSVNPVWVPSWQADLVHTADIASGATTITASPVLTAGGYLANPNRQYLALIQKPGTINLRQMNTVTLTSGVEHITLASSAGVDIPVGTGLLSFARYARLADDVVEMQWHRPGLATIELRFVEVMR